MNPRVQNFFRTRTPSGSVITGFATMALCWLLGYRGIGVVALLLWVATAAAQHLWIDPRLDAIDNPDGAHGTSRSRGPRGPRGKPDDH